MNFCYVINPGWVSAIDYKVRMWNEVGGDAFNFLNEQNNLFIYT